MSGNKCVLKFSSFSSWRAHLQRVEAASGAVLFVPTMGALHDGHGDLIRAAKKRAEGLDQSAHVVVSIFINPTQFDEKSDFATYPATPEDDLMLAEKAGADAVVFPTVSEMYPQGVPDVVDSVDYGALTSSMEGAKRMGHFDGVVAVVRNLLHQVQPQWAFFGEKDWQQLAVIKRLVHLEFPGVEVVPVPTKREGDGLAMSSRNQRMSEGHRKGAAALFEALMGVADSPDPRAECVHAVSKLEALGFEVEYLNVAQGDSLEPEWLTGKMRVFVAARWGGVRLIDNVNCRS